MTVTSQTDRQTDRQTEYSYSYSQMYIKFSLVESCFHFQLIIHLWKFNQESERNQEEKGDWCYYCFPPTNNLTEQIKRQKLFNLKEQFTQKLDHKIFLELQNKTALKHRIKRRKENMTCPTLSTSTEAQRSPNRFEKTLFTPSTILCSHFRRGAR